MRVLASLLLLASTAGEASAPVPAMPADLVFPEGTWQPPTAASTRTQYASGATAFVLRDTTLPLIDLIVVARTGAHLDPPGGHGVAEMTTTMLRRGGAGDRPPDAFDRRADELGARLFSVPTMLYGAVGVRCTSEVLENALELLLDMLESPRFDAGRWTTIRDNALEALSRRNLDGLQVLEREWDWLMYGEEHFSTRPLSAPELAAIEPADLREFHRRYWHPDNFIIAAGGDLDPERLEQLLEARFASWREASDPGLLAAPAWPPAPPRRESRPGLFHLAADIPQARVALGHRSPGLLSSIEDRVELEVLAEVLAGRGAISRLSGRLRSAEGLVYRVTAAIDPGDLWPADYQIRFDTRAGDAPAAIEATLEELRRLQSQPPSPSEVDTARNELIARRLQEFDTAEEAVGHLVEDFLVGTPELYRSDYRRLLDAVTADSVVAAARRHFQLESLTVVVAGQWPGVAGPVDDEGWSRLERLLGHRAVHIGERDPMSLAPVSPPSAGAPPP